MLLPVPVSPEMSTGISSLATLRATAMILNICGVSSNLPSSWIFEHSSRGFPAAVRASRDLAARSSVSTANRNVVITGQSSMRKLRISITLSGCRTNETCKVPMTSRLMSRGRAMVALRPTEERGMGPLPNVCEARSLITTGLREEMASPATVLCAMRVLESDSTTVPSAAVKRFKNSRSASYRLMQNRS